MKLYFDSCCFNRPFDQLEQSRVLVEALAVIAILKNSDVHGDVIVGSEITLKELLKIRDPERKTKLLNLFYAVDYIIEYNEEIGRVSRNIQASSGIKSFDSLHIASAQYDCVDVFLTTDDKLIKQCNSLSLPFGVVNPLHHLMGGK